MTNEGTFKIYPNPSNGKFTIDFNNNGSYSIEIYSVVGKKVFEKSNTTNTSILISNLEQGIYFVKLTKDSKTITQKVIIN